MKRFTIAMALVLLAALPTMAEHVAPETARQMAANFLNNNGAKAAQLTDLTKAAGFANLYIFTSEGSFVVMAADDCVKPILGYSFSDKFEAEGMPENVRWWLQQYSDEIQWAMENGIRSDGSTAAEWNDLKEGKASKDTPTVVVGPLLQTLWDQGSPYNMYCPSGTVTGCVATAMAQVMKYWNYPEQGQGTYSYTPEAHPEYGEQSADFGATTYDWANMTNTYGSSSTDVQKRAVATLMYHCGVSVDMNYGPSSTGGSGAVSAKVPEALVEYFKYAPSTTYKSKDNYTTEQWIALLQAELDENRPIFYAGRYETGGHAFVCDGYRSDNYFHFNWGWSGYKNDYWAIGALNPNPGAAGAGSGSGTYNLNNGAAFWVEPISSLAAPAISATAANGAVILDWEVVDGADSYDVYRDNTIIATNVTENNYTDGNLVSGTYYEYYVRAVAGTSRSNPSNSVTKLAFFRDYSPTDLTATLSSDNITLAWTEPQNNSATLQYSTAYSARVGQEAGKDTYWAEVFDPSLLTGFEGMFINQVSTYIYFAGNYKLIIYEGEPGVEGSNKLLEKDFACATQQTWVDIEIENPCVFDNTKELWVILFFPGTDSNSGNYPAPCGVYNEIPFDDETNPERYNPRLISESLTNWGYIGGNYSWLIKTYLTDGTYTYNLYDNGVKVNDEAITGSRFQHEKPDDNAAHQYTVKTNYYGGESAASNMAGVSLGTASLESLSLGDNDKMTIAENGILTVGTLSNGNAANLVIEDGAQLIHNSAGVKATVKKTITQYTSESNGWNLIASPVTEAIEPNSDNGLLAGTYDLYYYDEPTHYWMNHKKSAFDIEHKKGYLYANDANTELSFEGTLQPSDAPITIESLSHSATTLNGFNLVGNPFACEAIVNSDFYISEGTKIELAEMGRTVKPCEGIFIQATEDDNSVTFSRPTRSVQESNSFDLTITKGRANIDRARVRFSDESMEKFTMNEHDAQLYIPLNGKHYAVASSDGQTELPLNFKAAENGIYTLNFEAENLGLGYLHLIDNLTGNDVDLLASSDPELVEGPNMSGTGASTGSATSYTFEAKVSDYPSRFRLVFSNCGDVVGDNEVFAFVSNGEIRLAAVTGHDATLQIVDVMGRVVVCTDVARNVSTNGMPAGVYVLRLINDGDVKTQKIVID